MNKFKISVVKFFIRLKACYLILFLGYDKWTLLHIDDNNLLKLLQDKDFEVGVLYYGLKKYILYVMVKAIAESKDDIDMALDKAIFEGKAEEFISRN